MQNRTRRQKRRRRVRLSGHILVATDFSEPSRRALCDALALAAENNAQLSVIHVLQPDRKYGALENPPELDLERIAAERQIKALVDELGPEQNIHTTLVKHGPVAEQVAAVIEEEGIDLLVIGTRGRGGLQKMALGSVAEELLRIAPCPVMTIGPKADIATITHGPGFHRILFATDFGKGSAEGAAPGVGAGPGAAGKTDPGAHASAHAGDVCKPVGVCAGHRGR